MKRKIIDQIKGRYKFIVDITQLRYEHWDYGANFLSVKSLIESLNNAINREEERIKDIKRYATEKHLRISAQYYPDIKKTWISFHYGLAEVNTSISVEEFYSLETKTIKDIINHHSVQLQTIKKEE